MGDHAEPQPGDVSGWGSHVEEGRCSIGEDAGAMAAAGVSFVMVAPGDGTPLLAAIEAIGPVTAARLVTLFDQMWPSGIAADAATVVCVYSQGALAEISVGGWPLTFNDFERIAEVCAEVCAGDVAPAGLMRRASGRVVGGRVAYDYTKTRRSRRRLVPSLRVRSGSSPADAHQAQAVFAWLEIERSVAVTAPRWVTPVTVAAFAAAAAAAVAAGRLRR